MKATLERDDLARAVTQLKSMTGDGVIGISGTDRGVEIATLSGDRDMHAVAILQGEVTGDGETATAELSTAMKVVKGLPKGQVTVEHLLEDSKEFMSLIVGDAESMVRSPDGNDYRRSWARPVVPAPDSDPVPGQEVMGGLAHVLRAVSTDSGRAVLTRVLFTSTLTGVCDCEAPGDHYKRIAEGECTDRAHLEGGVLRMVATDGYRLHLVDVPDVAPIADCDLQVDGKALKRAVKKFAKQLVRFEFEPAEKAGYNQSGSLWVTTPRLSARFNAYAHSSQGSFPKYETLIPNDRAYDFVVAVERVSMVATLNRLAGISKTYPVRLKISGDTIEVRQQYQDFVNRGKVACEMRYNEKAGDTVEVAFNPVYLRDALLLSDDDTVTLSVIDGMKPATITDSHDRMSLIMPVKV